MDALGAQLNQLTPEQRQVIMAKAQEEANQQVMQEMMKQMTASCFLRCAGTSGDKLDKKEQGCLAFCQDKYLETRMHVQDALQRRQDL